MSKYIFVTGGVVSGLGKGITAASLGRPRTGRKPTWTWVITSASLTRT